MRFVCFICRRPITPGKEVVVDARYSTDTEPWLQYVGPDCAKRVAQAGPDGVVLSDGHRVRRLNHPMDEIVGVVVRLVSRDTSEWLVRLPGKAGVHVVVPGRHDLKPGETMYARDVPATAQRQ